MMGGISINEKRKTRSDKKPMDVRRCVSCGESFDAIPSAPNRFCSIKCAGLGNGSPPVERVCKQCGNEFLAPSWAVKTGKGLFCSRGCSNDHGRVHCTCLVCDKQFVATRHQAKDGRRFCSKECGAKGRSRRAKKPQTAIACQCCGDVFLIDTTSQTIKRKYCSKKCQYKASHKAPGEKAESFRATNTTEYVRWVKAVLLRDRACVRCGAKEPLQAHHVKHWRHHPELRYDVNNGATLCPCCHHSQHTHLPLEVFMKMGGKQVKYCVVCESPYVPLGKQQACSIRCGARLHHQRKKLCQ